MVQRLRRDPLNTPCPPIEGTSSMERPGPIRIDEGTGLEIQTKTLVIPPVIAMARATRKLISKPTKTITSKGKGKAKKGTTKAQAIKESRKVATLVKRRRSSILSIDNKKSHSQSSSIIKANSSGDSNGSSSSTPHESDPVVLAPLHEASTVTLTTRVSAYEHTAEYIQRDTAAQALLILEHGDPASLNPQEWDAAWTVQFLIKPPSPIRSRKPITTADPRRNPSRAARAKTAGPA